MSENKNETPHELNLWDLCLICFRAIGNGCRLLWQFCINTLRLSLQLWYIVLPVVIIGVSCGLYYSRKENRIYNVGAMVHLSGVNRTDVGRVYQSLNLATPDSINKEQTLATQLGLTNEQTKKFRKFTTAGVLDYQHDSIPDVVDKHNKHDLADSVTVVMPDYLYLSFQTKTPQEAQLVGESVINYLNNNKELQKQYIAYKNVIQRKAEFCRTQIEKLDSLTTSFYFEQAGSGHVRYDRWNSALIVGDRRIDLLHPDILELIETAKQVEKELAMATAPVVPMGEFVVDPRAMNGPIKCGVLGILAGYLLGCGLAYAWKRRKQFAQWVQAE